MLPLGRFATMRTATSTLIVWRAPGPPIDAVILATGYVYAFPFLNEESVGMQINANRKELPTLVLTSPARWRRPTLGFAGIQLSRAVSDSHFRGAVAATWARPGRIQ